MASTYPIGGGRYAVQFTTLDGKRRPIIRLGKCTREYAESVGRRVDRLLACQILCEPLDVETAMWVAKLPDKLHKRFVKAGLITERPPVSVAEFCAYCKNHFGGKRGTQLNYSHTEHNLVEFFTANRQIQTITKGDVLEFRKWLETKAKRRYGKGGLAPTTVTKRCKVAKQFFQFAFDKRWITENPFAGMRGWADSNSAREFYIDQDTTETLIHAARDPEMKLLIAFVRYAGLRCPSEIRDLVWDWVDWEKQTIKIYSPKTERHPGGAFRTIPIFTRLRPYLDKAWDLAEPGDARIFHFHSTGTALSNRMGKICKRAGVERWPKLWHNLRSSLETELADQGFSMIAITRWLGNSPTIAKKHYLQVTKEQHARAVSGGDLSTRCKASEKAMQNPMHRGDTPEQSKPTNNAS